MKNKNIITKKQKLKNSKDNIIIAKSKNTTPIRVLYKKTGRAPETKIIDNVFKLKKTIIKKNLDIIPYEKLYIICNNRKSISNTKSNIVLTFYSIYGDLILVDIDKNKREFKGLSQEDIIWYSQDLMNKSSISNNVKSTKKPSVKNFMEFYEGDFERDSGSKSMNYENTVLNSLTTIELALIKILKGGDRK